MNWKRRLRRWWNNIGLLSSENGVFLWLDDLRPAPKGWYHAMTAEEAQDVLLSCMVWRLSLDHDLGQKRTGYDVVLWLARMNEEQGINLWPYNEPTIHSDNPVGRDNMQAVIDRYGGYNSPLN
jgi:hypothetical protein